MRFLRQLVVPSFFVRWPLPRRLQRCPHRVSAAATAAVLPAEFAGWQMKGDVARSDDPAAADAVNAPVLKEYGFVRLEKAAYTRDDGRQLTIKAAVFEDASGAYGAFTYYYSDAMGEEKIGGQAAFLNNRVLFYQGNVLVDAVFDRMSVMSASNSGNWLGCCRRPRATRAIRLRCPHYLPNAGFREEHDQIHFGSDGAGSNRGAAGGVGR